MSNENTTTILYRVIRTPPLTTFILLRKYRVQMELRLCTHLSRETQLELCPWYTITINQATKLPFLSFFFLHNSHAISAFPLSHSIILPRLLEKNLSQKITTIFHSRFNVEKNVFYLEFKRAPFRSSHIRETSGVYLMWRVLIIKMIKWQKSKLVWKIIYDSILIIKNIEMIKIIERTAFIISSLYFKLQSNCSFIIFVSLIEVWKENEKNIERERNAIEQMPKMVVRKIQIGLGRITLSFLFHFITSQQWHCHSPAIPFIVEHAY